MPLGEHIDDVVVACTPRCGIRSEKCPAIPAWKPGLRIRGVKEEALELHFPNVRACSAAP